MRLCEHYQQPAFVASSCEHVQLKLHRYEASKAPESANVLCSWSILEQDITSTLLVLNLQHAARWAAMGTIYKQNGD